MEHIPDNFWPPHAMNLDENDEWVEVPLEKVLPPWMIYALSDEEDDMEVAFVFPYRQEEFRQWLMTTRNINEKSADDYLRAYESGYESLYEEVGIDLYHMLESIFEGAAKNQNSDLTKEDAAGLVKIYLDEMLEMMDRAEDSYTKAEFRALASYHAFIIDMAASNDRKYIKEKTLPLPDEDEFRSWLETEYKMDYDNIGKIVSSVKRMDLILPSMVTNPMTFLDVLRALPQKSMRENYLKLVSRQRQSIYKTAVCSCKTIRNGWANVKYYLYFLNRNN